MDKERKDIFTANRAKGLDPSRENKTSEKCTKKKKKNQKRLKTLKNEPKQEDSEDESKKKMSGTR